MRPAEAPGLGAAQRPNEFAYVIETGKGRMIGACTSAPIALAMYRAALDEFFAQQVSLRHGDEVIAQTC
jgi:hypothetical protein